MTDTGPPRAWLVISGNGHEAVFLERRRAEHYAAYTRGIVYALYLHTVTEDAT